MQLLNTKAFAEAERTKNYEEFYREMKRIRDLIKEGFYSDEE